jgi:hypothetical protein
MKLRNTALVLINIQLKISVLGQQKTICSPCPRTAIWTLARNRSSQMSIIYLNLLENLQIVRMRVFQDQVSNYDDLLIFS